MYAAIVIGGGFYGAAVAAYLAEKQGFGPIALIERESSLLKRASYKNQARIHNGYHYPRSFTTAFRSRVNLPHFLFDYAPAVKTDFTKVYAIARHNSKVTAKQFVRFCTEIGVRLEPAPDEVGSLFEKRLIESVFIAEEYAFDAAILTEIVRSKLALRGIDVRLGTRVSGMTTIGDGIEVACVGDGAFSLRSKLVFNCTYSGLNQFGGSFCGASTPLKHEISEMALIELPPELKGFGVTVMDGPFFSIMPFPSLSLHTLSHVRYTPHYHWRDERGVDPYQTLRSYACSSRFDRMRRDAERYMPSLVGARYVDSLFEVKTVLGKSETDDGRPILFERHGELPGLYSILGGKIDNIYDCLEAINMDQFMSAV